MSLIYELKCMYVEIFIRVSTNFLAFIEKLLFIKRKNTLCTGVNGMNDLANEIKCLLSSDIV